MDMKIIPTSTSMSPGLKESNQPRAAISVAAGILLALLASFLLFQYAYVGVLTKSIVAKANNVAAGKNDGVSASDIATAFANDPLNQNLVTAGFAMKSDELSSEDRAQWIAVIRKLGWRSTSAMQTLINEAVKTQDLRDVTVVADALLRRQKLFEETVPLMNLLEAEPSTWQGVYTRLKAGVPWRVNYLQLSGSIKQPALVEGRIRTLRALQASGDRLTRQELAPSIAMLVGAGKLKEAEQIWRVNGKISPAPLHDQNFRIAVSVGADTDLPIPFEWQFYSGTGFSAYPSEDGLNGATVAIQWDGRGLPVFMSQLTSAIPGNYRFSFKVDGDAQKFATKVGVRFRCGNEVIRLRNVVRPNSQIVTAETMKPITCEFPWIDIFGQIQDRGAAVDLAFNRATLERIEN
jgi:hypothetical protein